MKDIKLSLLLIFCFGIALGQTDTLLVKDARGKTLKRLGKSALKQNDPSSAITFFEAYLRQKRDDAKAMDLLAQAYMQIRDYDRAQVMFLKAYNTDRNKAPEALYYHAQMQKSNGNYDSARTSFQKFKKEYKGGNKVLKRQATREIVFCDSVGKLIRNDNKYLIQHLDTTINKVNAEGAPVALNDNTVLFSSLRTDKKEYIIEDDTAAVINKKVYMAERQEGRWQFKGEFPVLNEEGVNTGNVSFSADRKRLYFTRCKPNFAEKMICAIYMSEKKDGVWSEPVKLPRAINHRRYTSTMPAVTTDPAKGGDMIYFVSDRPKGRGGLDIWYTIYDRKKNTYKEPKNLGSKINTPQDEITPFFDNETRTLYYSSNGVGGLGGFDIYKATGDGKKFAGAVNIGMPVNTGADDIYYTISTNRQEGFLVSNRKGGNALKNSTCCDDIYMFKNLEYVQIDLTGTVLDMIDGRLPVSNAIVEVYITDPVTGEKFLVKSTKTDSAGRYKTKLEPEQEYLVRVRKKDFLGTTDKVSTKGITKARTIHRETKVSQRPKDPVPVPNIEYDFGKSDLTEQSKRALDAILLSMLEANPEIIVEVQAHTDSKGNELFNQKLSQKRADNIVQYIISKGISANRIQAKGYGESQPVAPNELPNGQDNPEGRAKNRRTEFKIIGTVDTGEISEESADTRVEETEKED